MRFNNVKFLTLLILILFIVIGCGGGGGGSSDSNVDGDDDDTDTEPTVTAPVAHPDTIFTNEDTLVSFNPVSNDADVDIGDDLSISSVNNGTKGLTTFSGNVITYTPNADENGVDTFSYTITDSTNLTSTATVTININSVDDTPPIVPVSFGSGVFPEMVDGYFTYNTGGQSFSSTGLSSTQAIGLAVFQNGSASVGEGNILITNTNSTFTKKNPISQKMELLKKKDSRYRVSKYLKVAADLKKNRNRENSLKKSEKSNRAADPIGTRDSFFHDNGETPGFKTFEKIYSGSKILIYSEVEPVFNVPYVNSTRGKVIGDCFEVSNPYNSNGKSIFDVDVSVFGNPWGMDENGNLINSGGQDGEKQIIILIFKEDEFSDSGLYGYFDPLDEEKKGTVRDGNVSNGAEIVYLNSKFANDDIALFSTFAHEFQHLIDYNQKTIRDGTFPAEIVDSRFPDTANWLFNEGQSVLAEELNGFGLKISGNKGNDFTFDVINEYISTLSVNSENFFTFYGGSDYGKGYLFCRYVYDTYGESVLKAANRSNLIQPMNFESATGKNIHILLQEFLLALMQTDSSQPSNPDIKITSLDFSAEYFNTTGGSLGSFASIDYINGFPDNTIVSELEYVVRLYKLIPVADKIQFTLQSIKQQSNYSIFSAVIDK